MAALTVGRTGVIGLGAMGLQMARHMAATANPRICGTVALGPRYADMATRFARLERVGPGTTVP